MDNNKTIKSALISVFYKEGLEPIVRKLAELGITIYTTGGTQTFIESLGIKCQSVESVTGYPSILGGRVKTLHPKVFGGILARRNFETDVKDATDYEIPFIDLVIVDLYPFSETLASTDDAAKIIDKIDIGGVSLIRAAAKNFEDTLIVASKRDYSQLLNVLNENAGKSSISERKIFAAKAFAECANYDIAISNYFNKDNTDQFQLAVPDGQALRYGENPHQKAVYYGNIASYFQQLHGKELSFNNLVDVDASCQLIAEFQLPTVAIIKHTNVCGIASKDTLELAWDAALAGDSESAFGGVIISNKTINAATAQKISALFFEILIAPDFEDEALMILQTKKNRILLKQVKELKPIQEYKRVFDGILVQDSDIDSIGEWTEVGSRACTDQEKSDLLFANIICKHLKSNAIALVKNNQLIGKGCGQTSRIDALKQALNKSQQFNFSTIGAVMASDAFFPFDDCVRIAHEAGITAVIQPGGSLRDAESIQYCKENNMAMVMTGKRHFRH